MRLAHSLDGRILSKLRSLRDVGGVVLADQVRSLDWRALRATYIGSLAPAAVAQVLTRTRALLA